MSASRLEPLCDFSNVRVDNASGEALAEDASSPSVFLAEEGVGESGSPEALVESPDPGEE
jgi:hypothetical protein